MIVYGFTTNGYAGLGILKGMVGYVLQLVSNECFLGNPNYCQVIFIVEYDSADNSCTEEVTDNDAEICDMNNTPPDWFPFLVLPNGQIDTTPEEGYLQIKPNATSYTYDWLVDHLSDGGGRLLCKGVDPGS